jgi:hypothetical protein
MSRQKARALAPGDTFLPRRLQFISDPIKTKIDKSLTDQSLTKNNFEIPKQITCQVQKPHKSLKISNIHIAWELLSIRYN